MSYDKNMKMFVLSKLETFVELGQGSIDDYGINPDVIAEACATIQNVKEEHVMPLIQGNPANQEANIGLIREALEYITDDSKRPSADLITPKVEEVVSPRLPEGATAPKKNTARASRRKMQVASRNKRPARTTRAQRQEKKMEAQTFDITALLSRDSYRNDVEAGRQTGHKIVGFDDLKSVHSDVDAGTVKKMKKADLLELATTLLDERDVDVKIADRLCEIVEELAFARLAQMLAYQAKMKELEDLSQGIDARIKSQLKGVSDMAQRVNSIQGAWEDIKKWMDKHPDAKIGNVPKALTKLVEYTDPRLEGATRNRPVPTDTRVPKRVLDTPASLAEFNKLVKVIKSGKSGRRGLVVEIKEREEKIVFTLGYDDNGFQELFELKEFDVPLTMKMVQEVLNTFDEKVFKAFPKVDKNGVVIADGTQYAVLFRSINVKNTNFTTNERPKFVRWIDDKKLDFESYGNDERSDVMVFASLQGLNANFPKKTNRR